MMLLLPGFLFAQWTFDIEHPPDSLPRVFGTNESALECFDPLDAGFPPFPMEFIYYFVIEDTLVNTLWKDIRPVADTVVWFLLGAWGTPGDAEPEKIVWEISELPQDYGFFYFDTLPDMSTKTNMSSVDSFIFFPSDPYGTSDTLYIQFIARVDTVDSFPPYAENWYPECGSEEVPVDIDSISVDILDAHSGVDSASITITLTGFGDITFMADFTAIAGGYHIKFDIPITLPYDSDIALQISASDNEDNSTLLSCAWHTESAITGWTMSGYVYDSLTMETISGTAISDDSLIYTALSNDSGFYSITGINNGIHIFSAYKEGYGTAIDTIVIADSNITHHFYLLPAETTITLSGTVYDGTTDEPIEGAVVISTWVTGSVSDTTDSSGEYEHTDLPGGEMILTTASAEGYIPDTTYDSYISDEVIDFYLSPTTTEFTVSGIITLEDETDHSGTIVMLVDVIADTTNASGNYEFTELEPDTYEFVAFHDGFETYDTTIVIEDSDIEISTELAEIPSGEGPPANVEAGDDEFADLIHLTWDPPGEYSVITYDDDDLTNSYIIPLTTDIITNIGVLYDVPTPSTLAKIEVGYYREHIGRCAVRNWDGGSPGTNIAVEYNATLTADNMLTFDFSGEDITLDGEFFVDFSVAFAGDTIFPIADSVYTGEYDDYTYIYVSSVSSWMTLLAAAGDAWSGFVWLVRVYVESEGGDTLVRLLPKSIVNTDFDFDEISIETSLIPVENPLSRSLETMELTGFNIYRAESYFDSPDSPYVELLYAASAEEYEYWDVDVEPETEYFYGITAIYDDTLESELSLVDTGRAIDFKPSADILVLDWDHGQMLAEGGTADEVATITDMISEFVVGADTMDILVSEQDEYLQHFMLDNYNWVFIVAGNSSPSLPIMFHSDTAEIWSFLSSGEGFFIEGTDVAYYFDYMFSDILDGMGVSFVDDGYDTANVNYLTAVEPEFFGETETFDVDYALGTVADYSVDEISPTTGIAILNSQTDDPTPVEDGTRLTYYDNGTCKIVFSSIYIGSIAEGTTSPETRVDIFTTILDSLGLTTSDIAEKPTKPEMPALLGNIPNPFNATTTIEFRLPVGEKVKLEVLDITGRIVATLVDEELPAGTHQVIWDGTSTTENKEMPSGIYTCRLITQNAVITDKMSLIK